MVCSWGSGVGYYRRQEGWSWCFWIKRHRSASERDYGREATGCHLFPGLEDEELCVEALIAGDVMVVEDTADESGEGGELVAVKKSAGVPVAEEGLTVFGRAEDGRIVGEFFDFGGEPVAGDGGAGWLRSAGGSGDG